MGSKISTKGDVYSFGILLLEIFTGKRPTDDYFENDMNLHQLVKTTLHRNAAKDIVDQSLMIEFQQEDDESSTRNTVMQKRGHKIHECLVLILDIGVRCSDESITQRMKISEALKSLQKIRSVVLKNI